LTERIIIRTSRNAARMSFLLSALTAEGLDAHLEPARVGAVWRLLIPPDQAMLARSVLRAIDADPAYAP
jgi:hypothetical protein